MKRIANIIPLLLLIAAVLACRNAEVTQTEKEMFVRGSDLSETAAELSDVDKQEKFTKTNYFDGSFDVDYEFESPSMYLAETITYEPKLSDARIGQTTVDSVIGVTLRVQGLEKVEVPNFYRYGDRSSFYILQKDGLNVGNYFTVLEGKKVFSLLVTGTYVDDPAVWQELIEPKLKKFSAYRPAG